MTIPMAPYQEALFLEQRAEVVARKTDPRAAKPPSVERAYIHLCRAVVAGVDASSTADLSLISLSIMVVEEWHEGVQS